jgi:hypothetical protein
MSKAAKNLEKKNLPTEQKEQELLVKWLKIQYPNVLFCASAGGMRTSLGTAIKMQRAGYSKGFPDIFIYEPRIGFHGLAIELKRKKGGVVSEEQQEWITKLAARGYMAYICQGAEQAVELITNYLERES